MSDIDTAAVDSLKALDPKRPIREATKVLQRGDWSKWANFGLMHCKKRVAEKLPAHGADNRMPGNRLIRRRRKL